MKTLSYKRILLKISGEIFSANPKDKHPYEHLVEQIFEIQKLGIQIGIVLGGGNILRGIHGNSLGLRHNVADQMGMLATMINCLHFKEILNENKKRAEIFSAISCDSIVKNYNFDEAIACMKRGDIALFCGGTGSPYFTTDTAAAIRAIETQCDILLKATKVDGVYDRDPLKYKEAAFIQEISYKSFIEKQLEVMDLAAVTLCRTHKMPICIFNMLQPDVLKKIMNHENVGTLIRGE